MKKDLETLVDQIFEEFGKVKCESETEECQSPTQHLAASLSSDLKCLLAKWIKHAHKTSRTRQDLLTARRKLE